MWIYPLIPDKPINIPKQKLTAKKTIQYADKIGAFNQEEGSLPLLIQLDSMGQLGLAEVLGQDDNIVLSDKMYQKSKTITQNGAEILEESKEIIENSKKIYDFLNPKIQDAMKHTKIWQDCIYKNKKTPNDKFFNYKTLEKFDKNGNIEYKIKHCDPSDTSYSHLLVYNKEGYIFEIRGTGKGIRSIKKYKNEQARKKGDIEEAYSFFLNGELEKYEEGYSIKNGFYDDYIPEKTEITKRVFVFLNNRLSNYLENKEIKDRRYFINIKSDRIFSYSFGENGSIYSAKIGQDDDSFKEEYSFAEGRLREVKLNKNGNKYDKIITYNKDGNIEEIKEDCRIIYQ